MSYAYSRNLSNAPTWAGPDLFQFRTAPEISGQLETVETVVSKVFYVEAVGIQDQNYNLDPYRLFALSQMIHNVFKDVIHRFKWLNCVDQNSD